MDTQNKALGKAVKAPQGTTFMLLYSSIGGSPYVAGGPSIVTEMGESSGMTNVFGSLTEEWPQVSREAVAEADPDVIILADLPKRGKPGDKWEEKAQGLENTPGTKEMKAVKNGSYVIVPGVATSASARSHEVVEAISAALDGDLGVKLAR
ncbi:MAG: ABC transporter substrate-binding protein [Corynebacterium glucuronolyticum]|nr:ABC transporter substrate-binding protein [Corynebacterium glucuronolyticum]